MTKLTAIILAAGKGTRIGAPKWQLLYQGKTFLDNIIAKLLANNIIDIACVVNSASIPEAKYSANVRIVINTQSELGMFSSIICGVKAFPDSDGYLIFPVDHPGVTSATIAQLHEAFTLHHDKVILPIYQGKAGHPIIMGSSLDNGQRVGCPLSRLDPLASGNLKQFLLEQHAEFYRLPVDDAGILLNINTPKDLQDIRKV
jgi:molybdenum cofactor cytidylyltransferase